MCGVFVYWSDRQELALVRALQYAKRDEVSSLFALLAVTEGCGRTQCDQIPNVRDYLFRRFAPQNCHAGSEEKSCSFASYSIEDGYIHLLKFK